MNTQIDFPVHYDWVGTLLLEKSHRICLILEILIQNIEYLIMIFKKFNNVLLIKFVKPLETFKILNSLKNL